MLVLTRRSGESVLINERTRITVKHIGGGKVTLAFDAPREVRIERKDATYSRPPRGPSGSAKPARRAE